MTNFVRGMSREEYDSHPGKIGEAKTAPIGYIVHYRSKKRKAYIEMVWIHRSCT